MIEKFSISRDDAPQGQIRGYALREEDFLFPAQEG